MKRNLLLAGIAAAAVAVAGISVLVAQPVTLPYVTQINPNDAIQDIPFGTPQPGNSYATASQLAGYGFSLPAKANVLIGGDASTNLWQRATTGASQTTAVAYGGPDRWAYWSGTSTAMTVSRDSTAAELPTGYKYAFKMARTSGQTGVVQMCMMQEVESANSYQFAGHTAELDFYAYPGANYSAASIKLTAYIFTGTGTDEGVAGTSSGAFGLNAGGGGSGGWTGQANATAAVITMPALSTMGRYAAVAAIPAAATEIGVAICETPVGTAGTNDYVALSGIQLVRNDSLTPSVSATLGYGCSQLTGGAVPGAGLQCSSFDWSRPQGIETQLQQRYYWQINEPAASKAVGTGNYQTSTICDVVIPTPVTMRAIPTLTIGGTAESNTTWAVMIASTTPVVLATTYLIQDAVIGNTINAIAVQATTTAKTAGQGCTLVGATGGANIQASSEL